jgi:hypothetical protein
MEGRDEFAAQIADELAAAFRPLPLSWARWAMASPAQRLADRLREFDEAVGRGGVVGGAGFILGMLCEGVSLDGGPPPASGPLLIQSNHPGLVDAMAVWHAVGRADLATLAAERELLGFLPHTSASLIFISPDQPMMALRQAARRMKEGGAVLTFPAGAIEPDPALRPSDAAASRAEWVGSLLSLASAAGAEVWEAEVSGVISPQALASPWARMQPDAKRREWAAASLQLAQAGRRRMARPVVRLARSCQEKSSSHRAG